MSFIAGKAKHIVFLTLAALCIVGNILLAYVPLKIDLSRGKAYSLSQATNKILSNAAKPVTITFFVSSDLPTKLLPLKRDVEDLLKEYKKVGGSKVSIVTVDPKKDQASKEKALENGITELQLSQVEQDAYAVTTAYFGVMVEYEGGKQTLSQVTDLGSLEYNLTAAIYKLTKKELPKVGIMGAEPVMGKSPVAALQQSLAQQFHTDELPATAEGKIDASYKTVLLFDDEKTTLDQATVDALHSYLNAGGSVVAFLDGVWIPDSLVATQANHGLFQLLKEYGMTLSNNLLLSTSAEYVTFGNEVVRYSVPYAMWLKTNEFNEKTSYFSNVSHLTFPWVSSLTLENKSGLTVKDLVKTTKRSWEQKGQFNLDPQKIAPPEEKNFKQYVVAAQASGKGSLTVVSSSRFVKDEFLNPRGNDNVEMVLNIVNDLASGGALSGMRQRSLSFYPLPDFAGTAKDVYKYSMIGLLPALFALYGMVRLLRRR